MLPIHSCASVFNMLRLIFISVSINLFNLNNCIYLLNTTYYFEQISTENAHLKGKILFLKDRIRLLQDDIDRLKRVNFDFHLSRFYIYLSTQTRYMYVVIFFLCILYILFVHIIVCIFFFQRCEWESKQLVNQFVQTDPVNRLSATTKTPDDKDRRIDR